MYTSLLVRSIPITYLRHPISVTREKTQMLCMYVDFDCLVIHREFISGKSSMAVEALRFESAQIIKTFTFYSKL